MSHDITKHNNGITEAFYTNTPAWHGLGEVVKNAPSSREAIKLAHLDWKVTEKPVKEDDGETLIRGYKQIKREDTNLCLGIVGKNYTPLQNSEAFAMLDQLNMDGIIKYESAFSLRGGKFVVLLAQLPEVDEIAEGDTMKRFVMFSNPHGDTSQAIHIVPTNIRVVCANTWRMALKEKSIYSVRHSSQVKENAEKVIDHLSDIHKEYQNHVVECRRLAEKKITDEQFYNFLDEVSPKYLIKADGTKKETKGRKEKRKEIKTRYFESPLNNFGTISRTGWAAYNAFTEFVDHGPEKYLPKNATDEEKNEANFFKKLGDTGSGKKDKAKAFEVAKEIFLSV